MAADSGRLELAGPVHRLRDRRSRSCLSARSTAPSEVLPQCWRISPRAWRVFPSSPAGQVACSTCWARRVATCWVSSPPRSSRPARRAGLGTPAADHGTGDDAGHACSLRARPDLACVLCRHAQRSCRWVRALHPRCRYQDRTCEPAAATRMEGPSLATRNECLTQLISRSSIPASLRLRSTRVQLTLMMTD